MLIPSSKIIAGTIGLARITTLLVASMVIGACLSPQALAFTTAPTPGLCASPSASGGFTLENCVPDGVAGKDTIPKKLGGKLDVAGIRDLVNRYIVVVLLFMGSAAVAIIVFKATDIALYASNDGKRKEAIKAIQWVIFGLLGATLAYMIITSIIRGFYGLAGG